MMFLQGFFGKGLHSKGPPKKLSEYLKEKFNIAILPEDRERTVDATKYETGDVQDEPLVLSHYEVAMFL